MNAYKKGVSDGIEQARKIVKNDIVSIYGIMACILLEMENTEDEVINLLSQIQERWETVTASDESMKDYLKRVLPFELYQEVVE